MFIVTTHALHCLYDIQVEFLANILYPAYITICAVSYDSPEQFFIHMPIYVITHPMYMSCEPLSQYSLTEADLDNCHYDSIKYSQRIDWRAAPEILSTIFFTTHSVQYMVAVDKKS